MSLERAVARSLRIFPRDDSSSGRLGAGGTSVEPSRVLPRGNVDASGRSHACGHDGHVLAPPCRKAVDLVLLLLLLLLWSPGRHGVARFSTRGGRTGRDETDDDGGRIIDDEQTFGPRASAFLHIYPYAPTGVVLGKPDQSGGGARSASSSRVEVTTAIPDKNVDPVLTLSHGRDGARTSSTPP